MIKKHLILLLAFILFSGNITASANSYDSSETFIGKPDTSKWFAWDMPDDIKAKGTAIDVSFMLDAPAGKHGFAKREGEDIFFEDGVQARFWGTNVVAPAMFDTKENLEKLADRLCRSGFNLVRLHHMDADWAKMNIFGKSSTTRKLNDEMVDKVFYLISLLKERGIYVYVDLLVSRGPYCTEDEIPFGGADNVFKQEAMYDPFIIELQKEYASQLLTKVNPYTGLSLANDPALVFIALQNEQSLIGGLDISTSYYKAEMQKQFNAWLKETYGTMENLKTTWKQFGRVGVGIGEDFNKATVKIPNNYKNLNYSDRRMKDVYTFLYVRLEKTYVELRDYLREIGVKCLITGTTIGDWTRPPILNININNLDFTDKHAYKSHPNDYGFAGGSITSALSSTIVGGGEIYLYLPWMRAYNQPYVVSEWQICSPNQHVPELGLMLPAYASFQNWHMIQFDMLADYMPSNHSPITAFFDTYNDPSHTTIQPVSTLIFNRGEVKEAEYEYFTPTTLDETLDSDYDHYNGLEDVWAYGKVGVMFTDNEDNPSARRTEILEKMYDKLHNNEPQSKEINWNSKDGIFRLNTEYTNAVTGFVGNKEFAFGNSILNISNNFATVSLNSVTKDTLSNTDRMLLTTIGESRNSGLELDEGGTQILNSGSGPMIVEPIKGSITLTSTDDFTVYSLDTSGGRKEKISIKKTPEGYSQFSFGAVYQSVYYEIVRNKGGYDK